jgi:hypothetical protein
MPRPRISDSAGVPCCLGGGRTRPGYEKLLVAMKDGTISGLRIWRVDWVYRSMRDLERPIGVAEVAGRDRRSRHPWNEPVARAAAAV